MPYINGIQVTQGEYERWIAKHEERRRLAALEEPPAAGDENVRETHLVWNGVEWVDSRCGCRYHPDDDKGSHGGAPHVHRCDRHERPAPTPPLRSLYELAKTWIGYANECVAVGVHTEYAKSVVEQCARELRAALATMSAPAPAVELGTCDERVYRCRLFCFACDRAVTHEPVTLAETGPKCRAKLERDAGVGDKPSDVEEPSNEP